MVRVKSEGRSKGCQRCRARKVKCDKASPVCSQCLRLGKECSGAVTGMVFLHADINTGLSRTKKVVHAREAGKGTSSVGPSPDPPSTSRGSSSSPHFTIQTPSEANTPTYESSPGSSSSNTIKTLSRSSSPASPKSLPQQMDNSYAMTQQYISHWIAICQAGGLPWMSSLPSLFTQASNPSSFAVERCVLAASLGYHGKLVNSKSIMMEAYKWYGFGLRKQRSQLEHFHPETRKPSLEEICMPIMLTIFEIICGTGLIPYFQHVMGAARMLEIRGPAACGGKELQLIFRTVRTQMVSVAIFLRVPSFLAHEEWLTIPFEGRDKPATDRVIDILTTIPGLLARVDRLSPASEESEITELETDARRLKFELDGISPSCSTESHHHGTDGDEGCLLTVFENSEAKDTPPADMSSLPDCRVVSLTFYETAQALLSWVLSKVSQESEAEFWEKEVLTRCASLLDLAEPLQSHHLSAVYVRLALSLRVVGILSPSVEQRRRMRKIVESWRMNTAVGGFCTGVILAMEEDRKVAKMSRGSLR